MSTIAILGAGNVGQALASRALASGHTVRFGVRDPDSTRAKLPAALTSAAVHSVSSACLGADVVIVAVPAAAAIDTLRSAGDIGHAVIVDAANPIRWDNGPMWAPPSAGSLAQAIAVALPSTRVVKGFNHFGAEVMQAPTIDGRAVDALFAGDDAEAKTTVMQIATTFGFHAIDAGPLRNAPLLENLAVLWIHTATVGGRGRYWAIELQ